MDGTQVGWKAKNDQQKVGDRLEVERRATILGHKRRRVEGSPCLDSRWRPEAYPHQHSPIGPRHASSACGMHHKDGEVEGPPLGSETALEATQEVPDLGWRTPRKTPQVVLLWGASGHGQRHQRWCPA